MSRAATRLLALRRSPEGARTGQGPKSLVLHAYLWHHSLALVAKNACRHDRETEIVGGASGVLEARSLGVS